MDAHVVEKCGCCGNETDGESVHAECNAEWSRRINDRVCTRCGKGSIFENYRCKKCDYDSAFKGYPGGQA